MSSETDKRFPARWVKKRLLDEHTLLCEWSYTYRRLAGEQPFEDDMERYLERSEYLQDVARQLLDVVIRLDDVPRLTG